MNEEEINPDTIYDDLIEVSETIKPFISRTQEFLFEQEKIESEYCMKVHKVLCLI